MGFLLWDLVYLREVCRQCTNFTKNNLAEKVFFAVVVDEARLYMQLTNIPPTLSEKWLTSASCASLEAGHTHALTIHPKKDKTQYIMKIVTPLGPLRIVAVGGLKHWKPLWGISGQI